MILILWVETAHHSSLPLGYWWPKYRSPIDCSYQISWTWYLDQVTWHKPQLLSYLPPGPLKAVLPPQCSALCNTHASCSTVYKKDTELPECCGFSIRKSSPLIPAFLCVCVFVFRSFPRHPSQICSWSYTGHGNRELSNRANGSSNIWLVNVGVTRSLRVLQGRQTIVIPTDQYQHLGF